MIFSSKIYNETCSDFLWVNLTAVKNLNQPALKFRQDSAYFRQCRGFNGILGAESTFVMLFLLLFAIISDLVSVANYKSIFEIWPYSGHKCGYNNDESAK